MKQPALPLFKFYQQAEKLKSVLRHSWLSSGRQESVAEHSWMMGLLAMMLLPKMKQKLNTEKVLMMIVVHDLAEAITEDDPVWDSVENKREKEAVAMKRIVKDLDEADQKYIMQIWNEYEDRRTNEAKFVKAIDTLDVLAQHNLASPETWDDNDYLWQLSPVQHEYLQIDPYLQEIKQALDEWSIDKATEAGGRDKLDQEELGKRV